MQYRWQDAAETKEKLHLESEIPSASVLPVSKSRNFGAADNQSETQNNDDNGGGES